VIERFPGKLSQKNKEARTRNDKCHHTKIFSKKIGKERVLRHGGGRGVACLTGLKRKFKGIPKWAVAEAKKLCPVFKRSSTRLFFFRKGGHRGRGEKKGGSKVSRSEGGGQDFLVERALRGRFFMSPEGIKSKRFLVIPGRALSPPYRRGPRAGGSLLAEGRRPPKSKGGKGGRNRSNRRGRAHHGWKEIGGTGVVHCGQERDARVRTPCANPRRENKIP